MESQRSLAEMLGSLSLFSDLSHPELEAAAHTFSEAWFAEGQRVLRQGFSGTAFHLIAAGEAMVRINGKDIVKLGRGDFFGEISILLGEPPTADIVALGPLHCLTLAGPATQGFLETYPKVMYRLLQAEALRLKHTMQWQS
ncbi:MAG TPA: cyclic nucleotide-binding domain-containing protein [Actinomycetota bacterium]|nr:cyclic nucleotide-binding domain-containing protein [Actinomycetota bacterium]